MCLRQKYRDVRGNGVLGGRELPCGEAAQRKSAEATTGRGYNRAGCRVRADAAPCISNTPSAAVTGKSGEQLGLAKQNIGFSRIGKQVSTTSTSKLPCNMASWPDLSLQSKQSCSTSLRAIRLQQRCNLDSRRSDAYTSFLSNLQFGGADGVAPV